MLDDLFEMFEQHKHKERSRRTDRYDHGDSGHHEHKDRDYFEDISFFRRRKKVYNEVYDEERTPLRHGHFPLMLLLRNKTILVIAGIFFLGALIVLTGLFIVMSPTLKRVWDSAAADGIQGIVTLISTWLTASQSGK